jgi:hypothetical protein
MAMASRKSLAIANTSKVGMTSGCAVFSNSAQCLYYSMMSVSTENLAVMQVGGDIHP